MLPEIEEANKAKTFPVEEQATPELMEMTGGKQTEFLRRRRIMEERDAIVLAETGSGKSLAFFAPLLEKIKRGSGL